MASLAVKLLNSFFTAKYAGVYAKDAGREYGVNSPDGQLIINKGNLANLALFLALLAVKRSDFCFAAGHAMFCKGLKRR